MSSAEEKQRHRKESLARVRALPRHIRAAKSAAIVERLLLQPALAPSPHGYVLAFAALPSEPDLSSLPFRAPGTRFCLPRVVGPDRLALHHVTDFSRLVLSGQNIAEPDPVLHPEIALADLTAILVPGIAFSTRTGHRLGRGGGYYDRFLALPDLAAARRIAVCFDGQASPEVPAEAHDSRVHAILTDLRIIVLD